MKTTAYIQCEVEPFTGTMNVTKMFRNTAMNLTKMFIILKGTFNTQLTH